jgi:hypothetical protein
VKFQRCAWSEDAAQALAAAVVGSLDALRAGVMSGRLELWRLDAASYAITETYGDEIFVHCYQGRDLRQFAAVLVRIAQKNDVRRVRFESPEPHTLKLLQEFEPREVSPNVFEIRVHPLYANLH